MTVVSFLVQSQFLFGQMSSPFSDSFGPLSSTQAVIIEREPNNSAGQANIVSLRDSLLGAIQPSGDIDYFRFQANANDTVEIFLGRTGSSELVSRVAVYDSAGNSINENNWFPSAGSRYLIFVPLASGTYYVRQSQAYDYGNYPNAVPNDAVRDHLQNALSSPWKYTESIPSTVTNDTGSYALYLRSLQSGIPMFYENMYFGRLTATKASFVSYVHPRARSTTVTFQYGLTTALGSSVDAVANPYTGIYPLEVKSRIVTGLSPSTNYYVRSVGQNTFGSAMTPTVTITTPPPGDGWVERETSTQDHLRDVAFAGDAIGLAVGSGGTVLRTTNGGLTWSTIVITTQPWLTSVAMANRDTAVAVGYAAYGGRVHRTTNGGLTWVEVTAPVATNLEKIRFISPTTAFAVGGNGTILRTTNAGATWATVSSPVSNSLYDVHFYDQNNGFIVGSGGTLLKTTNGGTSWTSATSGTANDLYGVWFHTANSGVVVGSGGQIRRTTNGGVSWSPISTPTVYYLLDVVFVDADRGVAVGAGGEVYRTGDGGSTWVREESGYRNWLMGAGVARNRVTFVGDFGAMAQKTFELREVEPNNVASSANLISYGDQILGTINPAGDIDYFKFSATAGDTIEIFADTTSGSSLWGQFVLYDSLGTVYGYGYYPHPSKVHRIFPVAASKTYYLRYSYIYDGGSFPNSTARKVPGGPPQRTVETLSSSAAQNDTGSYRIRLQRFSPSAPEIYYFYTGSTFSTTVGVAAEVAPNGLPTSVRFEYGTSPGLGSILAASPDPVSGIDLAGVFATLTGLTPNTTYYYRVVATNSAGTVQSDIRTFNTPLSATDWANVSYPTDLPLIGIAASSQDSAVVVGGQGLIIRTSNRGTSWTQRPSGTGQWLYGVTFRNSTSAIAVGEAGTILKSDDGGVTWSSRASSTSNYLWRVHFPIPSTGYAVGGNGTVVKTTTGGDTWTLQSVPTANGLLGVHFYNDQVGIAVGYNGTIIKTINGGNSWQMVQPPGAVSSEALSAVWMLDASKAIIVGSGGVVLRTIDGGSSWTIVPSDSYEWLLGLTFKDSQNGYAVGSGGEILRTTDGGLTWSRSNSGTFNWLYAVAAAGRSTFAVGDYGTVLHNLGSLVETEPNNIASQATQIKIGESALGRIAPVGDVDYFVFRASPNDTVDIYLEPTGNSQLQATKAVFDSVGRTYFYDSYPTFEKQHIVFRVPFSGPFYIRVAYGTGGTFPNSMGEGFNELSVAKNSAHAVTPDTGGYMLRLSRFVPSAPDIDQPFVRSAFSNSLVVSSVVGPNGLSTNVGAQYGPTTSYGNNAVAAESPVSGITLILTNTTLSGLSPNTVYHFRGSASNSRGTSLSSNVTYTTPPAAEGWVRSDAGVTQELLGVAFTNARRGFSVGTSGTVLRTTDAGASWSSQQLTPVQVLRAVSFPTDSVGFVVGLNGGIFRTLNAGSTWAQQTSPTTQPLRGVHFVTKDRGMAVGNNGVILSTTNGSNASGSTWIAQTSNVSVILRNVFMVNSNLAFAVGDNGTILRTQNGGSSWSAPLASSTTNILYGVWFFNTTTGFVAGQNGTLFKTTDGGDTWSSVSVPTAEFLTGIHFGDQNNGTIVGTNGVVLKTTNGGTSWTLQASGTFNILYGAVFPHPDTGYAVGSYGAIIRYTRALVAPVAPVLASPEDGARNLELSLALQWQPSATATSYHAQVATSSDFQTGKVVDDSTVVETQKAISGLSYNTTYYWRVRARNQAGVSAFSQVWSFVTKALPAPAAPVLATPSNGAANQSTSLTLGWNAVATATSYHVQLSATSDFSGSLQVDDSLLTDVTYNVSGLSTNTTYYWRVRAKNSSGYGPFSTAFNFTTTSAGAPSATTNPPTAVTTSFAIVSGIVNPNGLSTSAGFQYSTSSDYPFESTVDRPRKSAGSGSSPVTIADTLRGLQENTTYYYRIVAANSQGETFGSTQSFTTVPAPAAPSNLTAFVLTPTSVRLDWSDNSDIEVKFLIERRQTGSFSLVDSVGANVTTYRDSGLTSNATYTYRVRAANVNGVFSPYSNEVTVTTVVAPKAVLSATLINFGLREALTTKDTTLTISNNGFADLQVTGTSLAGPDASFFSIVSGGGNFTLSPGQQRSIVVRFAPPDTGFKIAYLNIETNDLSQGSPAGTLRDTLTGRGVDTTPPGPPISLVATPQTWHNGMFTFTWFNPQEITRLKKFWYRVGAAPTTTDPGTAISIDGDPGAPMNIQVSISTPGVSSVYGYLEDGAGNKNPTNNRTVTVRFDNTPPTVTDNSSISTVIVQNGQATNLPTITATGSKADGLAPVKSMRLYYKRSGEPTWMTQDFTGASLSFSTTNDLFVVNGKTSGLDYWILATDSAGNNGNSSVVSIPVEVRDTQTYPGTLPPATSFATKEEKVKAYRIIAVPRDLADKKPSSFLQALGDHASNGVNYVNWAFYRSQNGQFEDYEKFKSQNAISYGLGYFLIVSDASKKPVAGAGTVPSAQQLNNVGLSLPTAGWHLIGNPFETDFKAESLRVATGTIQTYARFTGGSNLWEVSSNGAGMTMAPWEGMAIKVSQAANLLFRSSLSTSISEPTPPVPLSVMSLEDRVARSKAGWLLKVSAYRTDIDMRDEGNVVGMVEGARVDYDEHDLFEPPFIDVAGVRVHFENEGEAMMRDIRPMGDGATWKMKIAGSSQPARVRLHIEDGANFAASGVQAYLLDLDEKMAYDLRRIASVDITLKPAGRNFEIVAGTAEFIGRNTRGIELVPSSMKLYGNYPNPFNPETIIRYAIPGDREFYNVSLKVFNIIGQEVATIVDGEQPGGYYEIPFNGRELSSGTYIYRLTIHGRGGVSHTDVKKMLLLK